MPYLQPKTSGVFGFMPYGSPYTAAVATWYAVSSSEGQISAGDVVVLSTIPGGSLPTVRGIVAGAGVWTTGILGVAAQSLPANGGSTSATLNSNTTQLILVYDDPNQLYVVSDQASSASGFLQSSQSGQSVSVLATGGLGSSGAFGPISGQSAFMARSNQVISGGTTGILGPFKLLYLHPIDQATSSGTGRKWVVSVNLATRTQGITIFTT